MLIKTEHGENQFNIKCKNEKEQELYNQNPNRNMLTGHFEIEARKFSNDSIPHEIKQHLEQSRINKLTSYDNLLNAGLISEEFYELVNIDQNYFHAGAQTSIVVMNYILSEREKNILTEEQYTGLWEEAFKSYPVSNPNLMR
ncbi:hypothetical protein [uncultured Salegentibacter sp.]|uniref:hypothetical protein n=1 Tax=uncultured Salegentibacter sp. TaxID=259320 RepID=UPI0025915C7F|nr:hypothetical protein [uncultured Salegentibacter sp.]